MSKVNENQHILLQFRILTCDGIYKTVGKLLQLNNNNLDKDFLKTFIQNVIEEKTSGYSDIELTKIIFSYGIRDGLAPANINTDKEANTILYNYKHYKLAVSLDPLDFGEIINIIKTDNRTTYIVQNINGNLYTFTQIINKNNLITNKVTLHKKGVLTLSWSDVQTDQDKFTRTIGNNVFVYNINGKLINFHVIKPTKYINTIEKHKEHDTNFLTLDVETRLATSKVDDNNDITNQRRSSTYTLLD